MVQRREVQGPSLKTDLPKLGLVVAQHRRLPSWSQVVWDNFLAYFTPKRVWDGIKTSTLQHHARQLFVKSDVFANPANERGKQIQNMSSHLRLAWEVPLLLHEHCQDGQPEHIFFSYRHYNLPAICKPSLYQNIMVVPFANFKDL